MAGDIRRLEAAIKDEIGYDLIEKMFGREAAQRMLNYAMQKVTKDNGGKRT